MNKKLEQIFDHFLEDRLSEEEIDYLEYIKHHSPEEFQEYLDLVAFEEGVNQKLKEERSGELLAELVLKEISGETNDRQIADKVINKLRHTPQKTIRKISSQKIRRRRQENKKNRVPWLSAAIIIFCFGIGILLFKKESQNNLSQLSATVSSGKISGLQAGQYLQDGRVYKADQDSRITFNDGTEIRLVKGTNIKLNLEVERTLILTEGTLYAKVTKQKNKTLNFKTPLSKAEILGTEFSLIHEEDQSSLKLIEGRVKFTSLLTEESRIMNAGDELLVIQNGDMSAPFSNKIKLFTIVNIKSGRDVKIVNDNDSVNLSEFSGGFTLKAYLYNSSGLRFLVNGEKSKDENNPPYFVAGNEVDPFKIHPWIVKKGKYKIDVEFLSNGRVQSTETISLTFR